MIKFIVRRLIRGLISIVLFQSLLFILIASLPYNFSIFGFGGGPSQRAFLERFFGLDRPLFEQLSTWLLNFFRFDLGNSFLNWPTPVSQVLYNNAPRTLLLFLTAAILAYLFGIWLGKLMAWRRGGAFEIISTLGGVAAYTSFAPFLGFVVINVFGFYLRWFPYRRLVSHNLWFNAPISVDGLLAIMVVNGVIGFALLWLVWQSTARTRNRQMRWMSRLGVLALVSAGTLIGWSQSNVGHLAVDMIKHLVLPIGTVVTLSFGETMMIMRSTMLETLGEDYVLMARAKGMPDRVIRDRHAARNAILPVMTRLLLNLPFVLIGSLVIERVFFWQAMGTTLFVSIEYLDMPVIMGVLSVVGVITVLAHIVLDIIYYIMDPRLRYATVA